MAGSRLRSARVPVLVLFAFAAGVFIGASKGLSAGVPVASASTEAESPYHLTAQLARVLVQIENGYVDATDRKKLLDGAIAGMVEGLDPHSGYLAPDEWKLFRSETEGQFGGVGIEIDGRTGELIVLAPIDGGPAQRAGVQSGDRIVAVDAADVRGLRLEELVKKMRGEPGSKVRLVVMRGQKEMAFDLVREVIHLSSVSYKALDGGVGYLRIKQFQERTHGEVLGAAAKLREAFRGAPRAVILDMRSNPGGLVDEAVAIADEFLAQGTIYTLRHRGRVVEEERATAGGAFATSTVIILVNEWTASAAELVAGALQDNARAEIIGVPTFGKGSVQTIMELPGGAGLKLTTGRYFAPSGHAIQADGIHPNVLLEATDATTLRPPFRERDLQNHLSPEGPQGGAPKAPVTTAETVRVPVLGPTVLEKPASFTADPRTGTDVALKLAYEKLARR